MMNVLMEDTTGLNDSVLKGFGLVLMVISPENPAPQIKYIHCKH